MKRALPSGAVAVGAAALLAAACGDPIDGPKAVTPPGSWAEELNIGISRAFVASKTAGCGQYRFKALGSNRYIVQCSRDGETWKEYWVNADNQTVVAR